MKEVQAITVPRELEKPQAFSRSETEAPIALIVDFLETNLKWQRPKLLPKTSIHNQAHDAIVPQVSQANPGLCSNRAIAIFWREHFESSLYDYDIFALAARQHSARASSAKASRTTGLNLLPHENKLIRKRLRLSRKVITRLVRMNRTGETRIGTMVRCRRKLEVEKMFLQLAKAHFSFRLFISEGYKSSVETFSTEASKKSSVSVTHRNRASICDNVPRLTSRPPNWQRVASWSCVNFNLIRSFLICGPTIFAGLLVWAILNFGLDPIPKSPFHC